MAPLLLVFLLSGAAGLVYQVVWSRLLVLVLGATSEAFAITVAAFMAGLAIGSALAGRRAERLARPVRAYALLEAAIAASAGAVPAAVRAAEPVYIAAERLGVPGARLALTAAILLVPTSVMGATLPVLARLARERAGRDLARLYGANTLGATAGCLAAGWVLIEVLGLAGTARVAVAANLVAAAGALALGDRPAPSAAGADDRRGAAGDVLPPRTADAVYLLTGFLALALEILWTRLLVPRTGSEIYVFSAILAVYLAGIGLGSVAYALRPVPPTRAAFGLAVAAAGAGSVLVVVLASGAVVEWPFRRLVWVLLPATGAMGLAFPVGIALATPPGASLAAATGRLYAWNTLGGIAGALAAIFALAPALGSGRAAGLLSAAYLALGASIAAPAARRLGGALAAGAAGVALAVAAGSPVFLHPAVVRVLRHPAAVLFEHREDRVAAATAGAFHPPSPYREFLLVNGIGMTMKTIDTKMLAHLPAALVPDARRALVLCFGMGTSFRSSLAHPYERVVAVDLVPTVPSFMRYYHADAETILADPRGAIVIDDARHFLEATGETFEIISSDPPPPIQSAGTVLLYSREFYEAGRRRLAPGGVFVQWLPFEGGTIEDYRTHVRTFLSVFPHATAWRAVDGNGFYLVGSEGPHAIDRARAAEALGRPAVRADIAEWTPSFAGLSGEALADSIAALRHADDATLRAAAGDGPIITDDRPRTEYYWLRRRLGLDPSPPGWGEAVLGALGPAV